MAVLYQSQIAEYDDSIQPEGLPQFYNFGIHIPMKKLHHHLHLVIEGPDGSDITNCVQQAAGHGLLAAVVAVFVTGGARLEAAEAVFIADLARCLGNAFSVKFDNRMEWVHWKT